MDQRQTGGEWEFELGRFRQLDALSGEVTEHVVIELKPPHSSWGIKVGVFDKKGKFAMSRVFLTPYAHRGVALTKTVYGSRNQEAVKNLPREAKRAIRRAFPLAVLML